MQHDLNYRGMNSDVKLFLLRSTKFYLKKIFIKHVVMYFNGKFLKIIMRSSIIGRVIFPVFYIYELNLSALPIFESWLPFLQKGFHAFFTVFHGKGGMNGATFEQQTFMQAGFPRTVHALLDHHQHG